MTGDAAQAQAAFAAGLAHQQRGEWSEAAQAYRRATQFDRRAVVAFYNLGLCLQNLGDLDGAADAYGVAIALRPALAEAHVNLGNVRLAQGRVEDAARCASAALQARPRFAPALNLSGIAQLRAGRTAEARAAFAQALAADPAFTPALENLADVAMQLRDTATARGALQRLRALDPHDSTIAFKLAALQGESQTHAPDAFVAKLFDDMAPTFDAHLTGRLGYQIPALLRERLEALELTATPLDVLDLGCGTGLFGMEIRRYARTLVGCDLSPRMIETARARAVYDRLEQVGLEAFLQAQAAASADIIAATDVFVYVGDLHAVFAQAARVLRPRGVFAFSVERLDDADDFRLQPSTRFAHSDAYVLRLAANHGFATLQTIDTPIRTEHGAPIPGTLHVFSRTV